MKVHVNFHVFSACLIRLQKETTDVDMSVKEPQHPSGGIMLSWIRVFEFIEDKVLSFGKLFTIQTYPSI